MSPLGDHRIEVWEPRWHDRVALVGCHHVRPGLNVIVFPKTKTMPGEYPMDGTKLRSYPVGTNGVIRCYEVPLADLVQADADQARLW